MSTEQHTKHTALPWILRKKKGLPSFVEASAHNGMAYGLDICGDDYAGYGEEEQREANMEFIVNACNSHYSLLEQNKALVEALKAIVDCYGVGYRPDDYNKFLRDIHPFILEARSLIAQVKP